MRGELGVELGLLLRVLVDALNHQVRVAKGGVPVGLKLDGREALLRLGDKGVNLLRGEVGRVGQAAAVGGGVGLHGLQRGEVLLLDGGKAGAGALDGGLAADPHRHGKALVGNLGRNLASLGAAAGNGYFLDVFDLHGIPLLGCRQT